MAFDGMVMAALTAELRRVLIDGRLAKIAMPEKDELLINIKNNSSNPRLLISAGASLPLIYLTDETKSSPTQAPTFCMLLRKHLSTARIEDVYQVGLERILVIELEHRDELLELAHKRLIIEMMGKYSNIIFADTDDTIIDSIKRVPASVSSIREVLPQRTYCFPDELKKLNPLEENADSFRNVIKAFTGEIEKAIYISYAGLSPLMAREICYQSGIDSDTYTEMLSDDQIAKLFESLSFFVRKVNEEDFSPVLIKRKDLPVDFSAFELDMYKSSDYEQIPYDSISTLLHDFYASKDSYTRMRQKTADIRKIVTNSLERASKKYDLQTKQLKDCSEKDKYKVYADLLNTYGYSLKGGEKSFTCENYYNENKEITIPLDEHKTATENAKRYYDKYSKMRRTEIALGEEITKTSSDIDHLSSILTSLDNCDKEADLNEIRDELTEFGYIKRHDTKSKKQIKSSPLHFVSSDGYDIYVGKNNYQNEEVTFSIASGNDLWFHAKNAPGSHVIVKCSEAVENIPDRLFEEAASLAAYYSSKKNDSRVEIDYTQRKNLKRVAGAAPGFVIYHTNYSMLAAPKKI